MSYCSRGTDGSLGLSLGGMVGVLRSHCESPHVFVRELLRLAASSVAAREATEPGHIGEIHLQLVQPPGGEGPTLLVEDNGIGLSEDEVLHGLATLGGFCRATEDLGRIDNPSYADNAGCGGDLVRRLSLGLVTCFAVADEVRLLTRSLDRDSPALEWIGCADGTYTLRRLGFEMRPGTQVYLRPRAESRPLFQPLLLQAAAATYGEFLPHAVIFSHGGQLATINSPPPWPTERRTECHSPPYRSDPHAWRKAQLATARRLLGMEFLDALPINPAVGRSGTPSHVGGLEGAVLIPAERQGVLRKSPQRVYHRGILLAEQATNLLPDWAGFLACMVNVSDLQPTVLFDGLREDARLARTRRVLGRNLHTQLAEMAESEPRRWRRILDIHLPTMKLLAAEHDEFFRLFIDLLPFDSSTGQASLAQLARRHLSVHYMGPLRGVGFQAAKEASLRPPRSPSHAAHLAELADALGLGVVLASDEQEAALLEKASRRSGGAPLRELQVGELTKHLGDLESPQRRAVTPFLDFADDILQPLGCATELKHFGTQCMLALLLTPDIAASRRDDVTAIPPRDPASTAYAQLWLNFDHPMVRQIVKWTDPEAIAKAMRLIYAHAKLACTGEVDRAGAKLLFEGLRDALEG